LIDELSWNRDFEVWSWFGKSLELTDEERETLVRLT
jgi:hypothetical protein